MARIEGRNRGSINQMRFFWTTLKGGVKKNSLIFKTIIESLKLGCEDLVAIRGLVMGMIARHTEVLILNSLH